MITEDGQIYTEDSYGGYGEFGGKDIYELIADMNGLDSREDAVSLLYKTQITNGERTYTAGGKDFFNWQEILPQEGKTPNQLVEEGWKTLYPNGYGDWKIAAKNGIKLPKLVENLPSKENWAEEWKKLPYPKDCKHQGYFY